ncbi:MAG: hypothetical protein E7265_01690 [Lachnospiraceae bacterium]|nr:hypothetical protein [Lachnospiraceae bacterium]
MTLETGETYNLKYKKKYTYKCSNKKTVTVSKKGKVKAKLEGKCVVRVYKKKKCIIKYNILVKSAYKKSGNGLSGSWPIKPGNYGNNFFVGCQRAKLEIIETIDENMANLYFIPEDDGGSWSGSFDRFSIYKYVIFKEFNTQEDDTLKYVVGDIYEIYVGGYFTRGNNCVEFSEKDAQINLKNISK